MSRPSGGSVHPHTGATYKIYSDHNGAFWIEVRIPRWDAITVSGFAAEAAAEQWIASHQALVAAANRSTSPPAQASQRVATSASALGEPGAAGEMAIGQPGKRDGG